MRTVKITKKYFIKMLEDSDLLYLKGELEENYSWDIKIIWKGFGHEKTAWNWSRVLKVRASIIRKVIENGNISKHKRFYKEYEIEDNIEKLFAKENEARNKGGD